MKSNINIYLESLKKEILPNNKRSDFLIRIIEKRLKDPAKENINKHHIFPRSWGGPDNKDNFVKLTESEHFKIHQLLYEVTIDKDKKSSMQSAYWWMSHQDGYKIKNHKEYERFQEEYRKQEKERNSGVKNAMHGKSVYSVWVEKYGKEEADKKLKNQSEKQSKSISGINNPNFGKKGSLHYKFGKKDSEETRNKKSGKNHHGYVHFSKEEESLIFELRKQKLSYPKIIDMFFENFNKKISQKIIPRVIRECKN